MSDVPGWAYAAIVFCVLFAITIVGLGIMLHRTRMQLRSMKTVDGSAVEAGQQVRSPVRQNSTRTALLAISRVFAKNQSEDDVEARSPMMADIGHSWESPPRPSKSSTSSEKSDIDEKGAGNATRAPTVRTVANPVRSPSVSSSHGSTGSIFGNSSIFSGTTSSTAGSSITALTPAPRKVRGPRQQPRVSVSQLVIPNQPTKPAEHPAEAPQSLAAPEAVVKRAASPVPPPPPSKHITSTKIPPAEPPQSTSRSSTLNAPVTPATPATPATTTTSRPPSRSAVTPNMATFSEAGSRPRPAVSVNTRMSSRKPSVDVRPMPLIHESHATNSGPVLPPASAFPASAKCAPVRPDSKFSTGEESEFPTTPTEAYSPDSMYSRRTSTATRASTLGVHSPDSFPPVPEIPAQFSQTQPQVEVPAESEDKTEVEAENEPAPESGLKTSHIPGHVRQDTAATFGHVVSPRTQRHTFGMDPVSKSPTTVTVSISPGGYSITRNPSNAASYRGHRRAVSDESYSSPAVEVTFEVDEEDEDAALTPRSGRPISMYPTSIDQMLSAAEKTGSTPHKLTPVHSPAPSTPEPAHTRNVSTSSIQSTGSFGSSSAVGRGGHRRYESDWSMNSVSTTQPDLTTSMTASSASLNSNLSSGPETVWLNTPRSSQYGHPSAHPSPHPSPTPSLNAYLNPSASVYRQNSPVYSPGGTSLRLSELTSEQDVEDYVATATANLTSHTRPAAKNLPRGALPAFLPGFPLPPGASNSDTPDSSSTPSTKPPLTPNIAPAEEGSWSSWGTNPDMERALFARLLALKNSSMGPLNMAALASISSIQSAMPSTPGGPDAPTPTEYRSFGSWSGTKAENDRFAATFAAAAAAAAATAANGNGNSTLNPPRPQLIANASANANVAAFLASLRMDSEELSTPTSVKPPDWDVTMWTRANVDGTL